jgi:hypothetical protein
LFGKEQYKKRRKKNEQLVLSTIRKWAL